MKIIEHPVDPWPWPESDEDPFRSSPMSLFCYWIFGGQTEGGKGKGAGHADTRPTTPHSTPSHLTPTPPRPTPTPRVILCLNVNEMYLKLLKLCFNWLRIASVLLQLYLIHFSKFNLCELNWDRLQVKFMNNELNSCGVWRTMIEYSRNLNAPTHML